MQAPTCFISYSWDDASHRAWVLNLADKLRRKGIDATFDEWDAELGKDLARFMEKISEVDDVIVVCTPLYGAKANVRKGGVGYESLIITGEMLRDQNTSKFIPLLRRGTTEKAIPAYLKSRKYVDFRVDSEFEDRLTQLLRRLHGVPEHPRPPLGPRPTFMTSNASADAVHLAEKKTFCRQCGASAGIRSTCPVDLLFGRHDFTSIRGDVHCQSCGVSPGRPTLCPSDPLSGKHSFVISRE